MKAISKRKKMDYISGYTMILPLVLGLEAERIGESEVS